MNPITVWVDGQACTAPAGSSALQLLERLQLAPPAFCHDPRLPAAPRCRLCAVELEGQDEPVNSCALQLREGMVLRSDSPALRSYRRQWLERLAQHCGADDLAQHPDKPLHQALRAHGVAPAAESTASPDLSHPLIRFDASRCISCQRCVQLCRDLQGQDVWHQLGRGEGVQLLPDSGADLGSSHCVACGACVEGCPTAALTDRLDSTGLAPAQAERWTRTVCSYCGVGCELEVGVRAEQVVGVRPVVDAAVNKGHLCVKGRYGQGFAQSDRRALHPMLRRGTEWVRCSWDEALNHVAERLQAIKALHGADAIGVLGSARATNEENYLAQKFARLVIGTHNVDCCARVCHGPTAAAMKAMLGTGAATNSYDDIERTRLFLIAGANPNENHPVLGARIKQQLRRGLAQAIVIDPRRTELAALAAIHLAPLPGTDVALFNALAHCILEEDLHDQAFAAARLDGLAEFAAAVRAWPPERAAERCQVPAADIRAAARLYASTRPAMAIHGLGLTEQLQGTETVMALVNLALLCGQIGLPGAGVNPLRGQNNVQGSAHMGCEPASLPGSVGIEAGRARIEALWGSALPAGPGLDLMQMLDAAQTGAFKALLVMGYDLAQSLPDSHRSWAALQALELLVVQDLVLNETAARFAHVFLPAASTLEKEGTFMNAERRVQRVRAALQPRGEARSDWAILCGLAGRMGHAAAFSYADAEAIWNEIRHAWPVGAGISYERLEAGGLQWPCRDSSDPGTTLLHRESFSHGPRARLRVLEPQASAERCSPEFPMLLITGRNLYQFNAATMSGSTALSALRPTDTLDMAPADAERLGVREGQRLKLISAHGCASLPCRLDARVQAGQLFASFHDPSVRLNWVTGPGRDGVTHTPEYKRTAVRVVPSAADTD